MFNEWLSGYLVKYPLSFNVYLGVGECIMLYFFCLLIIVIQKLKANSYEQYYCVGHYLNQQRLYLIKQQLNFEPQNPS